MNRIRALLAIALLLCVAEPALTEAPPRPTLDQLRRGKIRGFPEPSREDLLCVQEGMRMYQIQDTVWPNLRLYAPVPTLLRTEGAEYLIGHPLPPDDFYLVQMNYSAFVFGREYDGACEEATARPEFGAPTVVKAAASCTGEGSTEWVFDYTRRAFRVYLYRSSELLKVSRLNLPFPDPQERWKQAFPFPYDDPEVARAVRELRVAASNATWQANADPREELERYRTTRARLAELLAARSDTHSAEDFFKYVTWSEGVALYAAWSSFDAMSTGKVAQLANVRALDGFVSYGRYGAEVRESLLRWREISDDPLTFEDLVTTGAATVAACRDHVDDWGVFLIERDHWIEDLVDRALASLSDS